MTFDPAKLGEYSDQILKQTSQLNAASQFLVNSEDAGAGGLLEGPAKCVADLLTALAVVNGNITSESAVGRAALKALVKPVQETSDALNTIFVPSGSDLSLADAFTSSFGAALLESLTNPIAAMLRTQEVLAATGLDQVEKVFFGDGKQSGWISEYAETAKRAARSIFLTSENGDVQLGGLVMFAITEIIPGIEVEKVYLRRLKKELRLVATDTANLPPLLLPQLPNLAVTNRLEEAERALRQVESGLRRRDTWDAAAFKRATEAICAGQEFIRGGGGGSEVLKNNAEAFSGFTAAQVNEFKKGSFLPNVLLRLRLIEMARIMSAFNSIDKKVESFHYNLLSLSETLDQLVDTKLGDLMGMIVQLLRQQVSGLRLDLQAQAQGFNGFLDAKQEENINALADKKAQTNTTVVDGVIRTEKVRSPEEKKTLQLLAAQERERLRREAASKPTASAGTAFGEQRVDVYSFLSSQATTFVALSSLCFVCQRTARLNQVFSKLLAQESAIVRQIKAFIERAELRQCGTPDSGRKVDTAYRSYLKAIEQRLNGGRKNSAILDNRYKILVKAIEDHERYLSCLQTELTFGLDAIGKVVAIAMQAAQIAQDVTALIAQIRQMTKQYSELRARFETLDVASILGLKNAELSAIDGLFKALTCLLLQCDNPKVRRVVQAAQREFADTRARAKAGTTQMSSLDKELKTGSKQRTNNRVAALLRVVQAIQDLTDLDVSKLCALSAQTGSIIVTTQTPGAAPTVEQASPEQILAEAAAAREKYAETVLARGRAQ